MRMRWKKILKENPSQNNIFNFTLAYTKKKEDGSLVAYNFTVNIPDVFARMRCGERRATEFIEELYEEDPTHFYTNLNALIVAVKDNFLYKWGALLDANQLYFNPLWNVDGSEKVTEDRAKREQHFTKGSQEDEFTKGSQEDSFTRGEREQTQNYGNNLPYTTEVEYGLDEVTHTAGEREETTDRKTNPFNDTDTLYHTGQDKFSTEQVEDTDSRAIHTDTTTINPHKDIITDAEAEDTTTSGSRTDNTTFGEREDITENYAYKDEITTERHGNIGVTKSTELLKDYMELPAEMFAPILDDLMSYLSEGY